MMGYTISAAQNWPRWRSNMTRITLTDGTVWIFRRHMNDGKLMLTRGHMPTNSDLKLVWPREVLEVREG